MPPEIKAQVREVQAEGEEGLEAFWDEIRTVPTRIPEPDPPKFSDAKPNELVIGTSAERILVRIQPDGTILYGPDYTPDETAVIFWETMARRRVQFEERLVLFGHMERLLVAIGEADLANEHAQVAAGQDGAPDDVRSRAVTANTRLEQMVHRVIELGRGMALAWRTARETGSTDAPIPAMTSEGDSAG